MKKFLSLFLVLATLLCILTACGLTTGINSVSDTSDISPEALEYAEKIVEKDGEYTMPAEIAAYLHIYRKLPKNFITKNEAKKLGWNSTDGNLADAAPGKSIGGDRFGNHEGRLPDNRYYECDANYSRGRRGAERIIYSKDMKIYYTNDHYNTFIQLY